MTYRALLVGRARLGLAVLACAALLAACGSDPVPAAAPPAPAPVEAAPPTPPPAPPVDPLTGAGPVPTTPLVAVKIDNAPLARPFHRGLDLASVVYIELVEGGATRLLALYSQPPDAEVGPIRSFRQSDIELLLQHGRPAVGFSGANDDVLRGFFDQVAAGGLADASFDTHPGLYRIGERRADAKNFYAVPLRMAQTAAGAAPARDIGWTFNPAPRPGTVPAPTARVTFSDRESLELRFDAGTGRYAVLANGRPLTGAAPANVVVQQVNARPTAATDVTGAVTPYSETLGSGPVDVLRDGTRVSGTWLRPSPAEGTRLLDPAGLPIPLMPGPTWVLLQPAGLPITVG